MEIYQDKLIVGGEFGKAGSINASHIAAWDGNQWSALGGGVNTEPVGLAVYNGDLFAATNYSISRWNGTNWSQLPLPTGATSYSGAVESHAGFLFACSGSASGTQLSWWNGASWASTPMPISGQGIYDMKSFGGQLYVTGMGDSVVIPHARSDRPSRSATMDFGFLYAWNGSAFAGPGSMGNAYPLCLHAHNGLVYVGGDSDMPNGQFGVVAWDGSNWGSSAAYYPCCVFAMETYHGWLMLGYLGGVSGFDGAVELDMNSGYQYVFGLKTYHDELYVTGGFDAMGGVPASNISSWYDPVVVGVRDRVPNALIVNCAPNPFNPSVMLSIDSPSKHNIQISICDPAGRIVRHLSVPSRGLGHHEVRWAGESDSGQPVASGVYFARVTAGSDVATAKLVLLK